MLFINKFVGMYKYSIFHFTIIIGGLENKINTFIVTLTIELTINLNTRISQSIKP